MPGASQALRALKSIRNARDMADSIPGVKPGRVYRSACPITPNEDDARVLTDDLHIRHLVDLRSDYERRMDPASPPLLHCACIKRSRRSGRQAYSEIVQSPSPVELTGPDVESKEQLPVPVTVHHIALLERSRYYRALIGKLPLATSGSIIAWSVWDRGWAKTLAIREVNRMGLPGLYETILETSGPELAHALRVVTEAAEKKQPVLLFCKVGKDRTGMLACLIAACCGASPSQLVEDYHKSDNEGTVALGDLEADKELAELDVAMFSRAPEEALRTTLQFFSERYGGIEAYLDSIGFQRAERERLAANLSAPL